MTLPTKFYHTTPIVDVACDQSLVTLAFQLEKLSKSQFYKDLGWFWFKFNNLVLVLGMALKYYNSVAKGLKLKVRLKLKVKVLEANSYIC